MEKETFLTFGMQAYYMLKYPLNWTPAVLAVAQFAGYFQTDDDKIMIKFLK